MRSAEQFSERPALIIEGKRLYYWQLREIGLRIAATIQAHNEHLETPLVAVFAHRSATAFASALGFSKTANPLSAPTAACLISTFLKFLHCVLASAAFLISGSRATILAS